MSLNAPLIVVGMHRSGTSLLSDLLSEMGIDMGADRSIQGEARLFRRLNQEILRKAGASWIEPWKVRELLADPAAAEERAAWIRHQLEGPRVRRVLQAERGPWGWKDPRNALTLPVWLRVFPDARILHVVRNGIDVSHSLVVREKNRHQGRRFPASWPRPRRLWHQMRNFFRHGLRPVVSGPAAHEGAFILWREYLISAEENLAEVAGDQVHTLRFEDLLKEPGQHLREIRSFAAAAAEDVAVERIARSVDGGRTLRFRGDPDLERFYDQHRDDPFMVRHGYGDLIQGARGAS